ncbi:hypothetical protein Agub_g1370, partial [Astrephomene gubernaculifera]
MQTPHEAMGHAPGLGTTDVPPETDLEKAAQRVRDLEQQAIELHELAQRYNKEGRFQDAQAAYARMHELEDAASALSTRVGCVACVLGERGGAGGQGEQPSLCSLDPDVLLPYQHLHPLPPFMQHSPQQQQQQQPLLQPTPQLLEAPASGAPAAAPDRHTEGPGIGPASDWLAARCVGSVVGSLLGDAAAMGVHWVYDTGLLEQLEAERSGGRSSQIAAAVTPTAGPTPSAAAAPPPLAPLDHPLHFGLEFQDPPRSPFYAYPPGANSPYGEQTRVLLRCLAEGGGLHCGGYAAAFEGAFGPASGFSGYRDVSTKAFLRNYARGLPPPLSGAADAQANCIARLAPLVAAFGAAAPPPLSPPSTPSPPPPSQPLQGAAAPSSSAPSSPSTCAPASSIGVLLEGRQVEEEGRQQQSQQEAEAETRGLLLRCVELATRVTQNSDAAVAWACIGAVVLEQVLLGASAEEAVRHAVQDLQSPQGRLAPSCGPLAPELASHLLRVLELRTTPVPEAVAVLGRNCHMPNALQTPLQVVLYTEHMASQLSSSSSADTRPSNDSNGSNGSSSTVCGGSGEGTSSSMQTELTSPSRGASLPPEAYVWGVRLAVREGGCCASRAAYVGACLGAMV